MALTFALLGLACGGDDGGTPSIDTGVSTPDAALSTVDAAPPDAAAVACPGSGQISVADVTDTEGIAIAPDGTLYYSQSDYVGRVTPGGAAEDTWVLLATQANTVWGLALAPDGILYAASPSTSTIYRIDTTAAAPAATPLITNAMGANGLIVGPDGAVYYTNFGMGRVYRVDSAGTRTEVTASTFSTANGILFDDDGTLLVLSYFDAEIYRLTLDASMQETGRALVASVPGGAALDGIARDEQGRYYVTDNANGALIRFDASFSNPETLLTGILAAANIAFGKGALDCHDVYVASAGPLGVFHGDAAGRP